MSAAQTAVSAFNVSPYRLLDLSEASLDAAGDFLEEIYVVEVLRRLASEGGAVLVCDPAEGEDHDREGSTVVRLPKTMAPLSLCRWTLECCSVHAAGGPPRRESEIVDDDQYIYIPISF